MLVAIADVALVVAATSVRVVLLVVAGAMVLAGAVAGVMMQRRAVAGVAVAQRSAVPEREPAFRRRA